MSKSQRKQKRSQTKTTRREFFRSAGRGTLVVAGVALVGSGATLGTAGCGDDDDDGSNGYPFPEQSGTGGGTGDTICTNTCEWANDGDCDDGGPGSDYDLCEYGTDCADCGPRPR